MAAMANIGEAGPRCTGRSNAGVGTVVEVGAIPPPRRGGNNFGAVPGGRARVAGLPPANIRGPSGTGMAAGVMAVTWVSGVFIQRLVTYGDQMNRAFSPDSAW